MQRYYFNTTFEETVVENYRAALGSSANHCDGFQRHYDTMLLLTLLSFFTELFADGFVEEVACSSESLTVILNKSDPDIARWMSDPKAQPVVYVYGHKTLVPCGTSLKNDKGQQNYNLSIPYGRHCDVHLADLVGAEQLTLIEKLLLKEPNYRTAETTIALEDNVDTSMSKIVRINHVFCLYTRSVQTIRYSDVSTAHEVLASTGGKPKPKVEMMFRSTDGRPLRTAKFGDTVEFYVALTPDKAYHGISPKECMFSDREDMLSPDARHLTFVQSSCPVHEMSEIIDPLANVNEEVYFSKFKTFRFGNQSTVFAQCTVQNCFKRISNSNLTAERLRFRHRRSPNLPHSKSGLYEQVSVRESLTILDEVETNEAFLSKKGAEAEIVNVALTHYEEKVIWRKEHERTSKNEHNNNKMHTVSQKR
ncbi:zona pellucida-like domain protein [Ancylostoma ceylanicum]|uniref:Zona pellucida-like domain protein n=1 Tax=Ancylostoma ceylanicum TaxID=53326 RepID=A0A0D6LLP3_9BILA|nr:zona pellucida-like domain protein [Ancylostoma ceylanicum]